MTREERTRYIVSVIKQLHELDCAVAVFIPEELGGTAYDEVEDAMISAGNDLLTDRPAPCTECGQLVEQDSLYYSTFCGTYCSSCMRKHMANCEICRNEFED